MQQFKSAYNEVEIKNFLEANMVDGKLLASHMIHYETEDSLVLMTVYCIMYASNLDYDITIFDRGIEHKRYRLKDFLIERRG